MREFLASGQVGKIELDAQRKIREEVTNRWDKLGFTEGLSGTMKENMALLFENEAKHLLNEATDADNSGQFQTVVFPIIRRVFSKLLANDIVSVQAMNLPVGKLFFILPVTSEREWSHEELTDGMTGEHKGLMGYNRINKNKDGEVEPRYYLPDDVVNGTPSVVKYYEKSLYDLFYNDFLFDNSKGKVNIRVVDTVKFGKLTHEGMTTVATAEEAKVINGLDNTVRNLIVEVSGFASFGAGRLTGPDGNEMDTEAFLASMKVLTKNAIASDGKTTAFAALESIPFRVVTQRYGKGIVEYSDICDAQGKMYIELDLAKPCIEQQATIDGYIGIAEGELANLSLQVAWAHYDSLDLETEIGEVSFKLDSVTVSTEERKLRATWSPELAQDVSAFHNIDAESELTSILSEQIAAEIDREILRDLRKGAPWQARWDVNGWKRMAGFSTNYTQKDWNQELFTTINQISAQIHKATLRGGANFIVVSSEISALFDNLEYFHVSDASAEQDQYNMGIEKIGSLSGRYQVYRDPYAPHWSMIIGHKGKSLLDTGYVYAPYVPMQLTPTMYNPFNFAPVKGIMTRYAKKMVNNRYYGHVTVDGLKHWDIRELR